MVGLVIVSHSRALADALVELVRAAAGAELPVAAAGGVGDNRRDLGTDATDVAAAIVSVYDADGVVVLMDLGSAVLSAETALEFIDGKMRPHIRFCDAPMVEGAVAAGVQISLGSDLETVCREARRALAPKTRRLSPAAETTADASAPGQSPDTDSTWQQRRFTVRAPHGMHARPAARFVRTAAAFDAHIRVKKDGTPTPPVPATSLNSLTTLGIGSGDTMVVSATGPQGAEALEALQHLVETERSGPGQPAAESAGPSLPAADAAGGMAAIAVSDGIAIGPIFHLRQSVPDIPEYRNQDPGREWHRLQQAIAAAHRAITQNAQAIGHLPGADRTAIFDAHLLMLEDPELLERVRQRIFTDRQNAAFAWHRAIRDIAESYRSLADSYLRERSADVLDVGRQVLLSLTEAPDTAGPALAEPSVVAARSLSPNQTARLDMDNVLGLVTVAGGPTAHSAILARALGIPAVSGADPSVLAVAAGTRVAVDGFQGTVWTDPPSEIRKSLKHRRDRWLERRQVLGRRCHRPAITGDGHRIMIGANIGLPAEAGPAVSAGAEAVGLLRTEFLFMTRTAPPPESEQAKTLREIARAMGGRPIRVRTLDIGGDKTVSYLDHPAEANPLLGVRGIRWSLRHPDLFRTQLRAILQAADAGDLRILFPMVSRSEEIDRARAHLEAAHRSLAAEYTAHRWPIPFGIMIETPAAALTSASFARQVDFFSIGTNDLTQYTLAAARDNPELAGWADGLHPAVLGLVRQVVAAAHGQQKTVGICGELAADPAAVPVLIGLGVDELSMSPAAIPPIKDTIRRINFSAAVGLAEKVCRTDNAAAARRMAAAFVDTHDPEKPS